MQIFMVVPMFTNVRSFNATVGFRVFLDLGTAMVDLEERYKRRSRDRSGWSFASGTDPVPIVAEIDEELFSRCACRGYCDHHEYLLLDLVNPSEPILKKPVKKWERVTLEFLNAWEVQEKLLGHEPRKWKFKRQWENTLTSTKLAERAIMKR